MPGRPYQPHAQGYLPGAAWRPPAGGPPGRPPYPQQPQWGRPLQQVRPPYPPPRQRHGASVALVAVLVVVGLFASVVVAGFTDFVESVLEPPSSTYRYETTAAPEPTSPEPEPTDPRSTEPDPTPTTPTPTTPTPTDPTSTQKPYQNDDYRVPPPNRNPGDGPEPRTYGDADNYLQRNALYRQSIPLPVRCRPDGIDATRTSVAQRGAYYTSISECLMRVWAPLVSRAGYNMHRPTVTMYERPIRTACGTADELVNGFYCSGDGQIYIGSRDYQGVPPSQQGHRQNVDFTIAHEFGHAIQDRTGILASESAYEHRHKGTPLENTYSRRLEQQADCLAGLFTNSVAQARNITADEKRFLGQLVRNFGGRVGGTHGTPESREKWLLRGVDATSVSTCNTFIVPESDVQ